MFRMFPPLTRPAPPPFIRDYQKWSGLIGKSQR